MSPATPVGVKVGLVSHYMPPHPGGIERVCELLFAGYRAAGFGVRWVASRQPSRVAAREAGRVRVGAWNVLERRLDVPVPIWGLEGWREMRALLRWADVVHLHDCLYPGSVVATLAAGRQAPPRLLTQHVGPVPYRSALLRAVQGLAYRTLGRAVLRRCERVVAATPGAERWLDRLLGPSHPGRRTIPNGIDLDRFRLPRPEERTAARRQFGLAAEGPVVLFVGRLVEKKGVELVAGVARQLPRVNVLVVGDGPLRPLLVGAGEHVRHVPSVEPDAMPQVYHAASCLLLPSHGEGLPLAVQEAMACGLPLVASAGEPYAEELARLGVCTVARRRVEDLTAAVGAVLARGDGEAEVVRALAVREWNLSAMLARYVALVEETSAAGRTGGGS